MLAEPGVLRLLRFRPAKAAFDAVLRAEIVPAIRRLEGLVDVFAGRQGPGDLGPRLMASVWRSPESMLAALGASGGPNGTDLEPIHGSTECPVKAASPASRGRSEAERLDGAEASQRIGFVMVGGDGCSIGRVTVS